MDFRYLRNFRACRETSMSYDVIIIGSGIAGLFTALNIDEEKRILVVTKDQIDENNSNLAQGGIAVSMSAEDQLLHFEDTMKAGCFYNSAEAVKIMVEEGKDAIDKLIEFGVEFDRDEEGNLLATREGGHSSFRILHAKDATGKEIVRALGQTLRLRSNIDLMDFTYAVDIMTDDKQALGVVINTPKGVEGIFADHVVLATGGIGQLYKETTNSKTSSGDGIAMALRAGAEIHDMEFVQFHPTALYSKKDSKRFLISEALRGEGAILRNAAGEAFMSKYHELADIAPRDIVARAIIEEIENSDDEHLYLDITAMDSDYVRNRFPTIYEKCLKYGIDITKDLIPVCPVQHYIMGGIKTDLSGRTSIDELYACGETAVTGTHGANRLASNSLLEAAVYGRRVAQDINGTSKPEKLLKEVYNDRLNAGVTQEYDQYLDEINAIMTKNVFVFRNMDDLVETQGEILKIKEDLSRSIFDNDTFGPVYNICLIAEQIIGSAIARKESLGSHMVEIEKG